MIKVLVVEDHPLFARALESLLSEAEIEIVATASTKAEAIALAREHASDVVLMDYHLPDGTGAEAAAAIRAASPQLAVVMLTADETEDAMLAAVEAGVSGFLSKAERPDAVRDAIRRAATGEMLIPSAVLSRLVAARRARNQAEVVRRRAAQTLTPREREVLVLLARGEDNAAIAQRMSVAIATVRTYVQSVIEKLGAHSKLEAVVRAGELGLLNAPGR
jgi:DNA-binding NarL/FixJ family response regulator